MVESNNDLEGNISLGNNFGEEETKNANGGFRAENDQNNRP